MNYRQKNFQQQQGSVIFEAVLAICVLLLVFLPCFRSTAGQRRNFSAIIRFFTVPRPLLSVTGRISVCGRPGWQLLPFPADTPVPMPMRKHGLNVTCSGEMLRAFPTLTGIPSVLQTPV